MVLKTLFIQTGVFPTSFPKSLLESRFTRIYNMLPDSYAIANMTFLHSLKLRKIIPIKIQKSLRNKILIWLLENSF